MGIEYKIQKELRGLEHLSFDTEKAGLFRFVSTFIMQSLGSYTKNAIIGVSCTENPGYTHQDLK